MADADWVDVPVAGLQDATYLNSRKQIVVDALDRQRVLDRTNAGVPPGAPPRAPNRFPDSKGMHTTHFSVVDKFGNMIAMTSTLENMWGSFHTVPGRGFLLNNELSDFSPSGGPNRAEGGRRRRRTALPPMDTTFGGKRPLSSMTPTLVFRDPGAGQGEVRRAFGEPWIALGSPGGWRIICSVLNVVLGILDFGKGHLVNSNSTSLMTTMLQEAIDLPRVATNNAGSWRFEKTFLDNTQLMQALEAAGVNSTVEWGGGAVAAVSRGSSGFLAAAADSRRDGGAVSF
jgi:gamma-glutamyltranspeptidase / glutathione hydrolase